MKTRTLTLFSCVIFSLAVAVGSAFGDVHVVGHCLGSSPYSTISDAVAAASPYDTIIVCPGTYVENVLVDFGGNTDGVTITSTHVLAPALTHVVGGFLIISNDVKIKGFTITKGKDDNGICVEMFGSGTTVSFSDVQYCQGGGIRINSRSSGNTVAYNEVEYNDFFGINVEGTDNVIHHNLILNNAPVDKNFGGIELADISSNGKVHNNIIKGNKPWGIKVEGDNYKIYENKVCDGIFLQSSADNIELFKNVVKKPPGIIDNGATNVKSFSNFLPSRCGF